MKIKKRWTISLAVLLAVGTIGAIKFQQRLPLIKIASKYRAQMYCACIQITEQSPSFCEEWTQNPQVPGFFVPITDKTQGEYQAGILTWKVRSHFVKETNSCNSTDL